MNNKKIIVLVVILVISLALFFALKGKDGTNDNTNNENIDETETVHDSIVAVTNYLDIVQEYGSKNIVKELTQDIVYDVENLSLVEFCKFNESIAKGIKEFTFSEPEINGNKAKVTCDITFDYAVFTYIFDLVKEEDFWKIKLDISRDDKTNYFKMKLDAKKQYFEKDTSGVFISKETEWRYLNIENNSELYKVGNYDLMKYSKEDKCLYLKMIPNKMKYLKDDGIDNVYGKWKNRTTDIELNEIDGKLNFKMDGKDLEIYKIGENDKYIAWGIKRDIRDMRWEKSTGYIKDDLYFISMYSNTLDYGKVYKGTIYKVPYDSEGNYFKSSSDDLINLE